MVQKKEKKRRKKIEFNCDRTGSPGVRGEKVWEGGR